MAAIVDPLPAPPSASPSAAGLRGWRLRLARLFWAVGTAFAVALFLAYLPFNRSLVLNDALVQSSASAVARYTISLDGYVSYVLVLRYLTAAVSFGVAALIVWRKSDDAVALMVALGLLLLPIAFSAGSGGGDIYVRYGAPWHVWLPQFRAGLTLFAFFYIAWLFFIFPDGRFEPRWMKSVMWAVLALDGLLVGSSLLATVHVSWNVWTITLLLWWIPAVGSQIYRFLRVSNPQERQQTKWFVAAVAFMPIGWLVALLGLLPFLSKRESSFISLHVQVAWFLWLPLGVGFGVLRRGLWGVDPLINRTLVYGALTAFVISAYVVGVGLVGRIFQTQASGVVAILALIVIVPLIPPLRQRLQRGANRILPPTAVARPLPKVVESGTRLQGAGLVLVRLAWWTVALLAIGLLVFAVPARFQQLLVVLPTAGTQAGNLSADEARLLGQLGFSISHYAAYITALEVLVAVVDTVLAVIVFWRRSDDWMAVFVSQALMTLPAATPLMTGLVESQPVLGWLALFLRVLAIGPGFFIFYLFPNGRFVPDWTRWLALAWAGYTAGWVMFPALSPPTGLVRVESRLDTWIGLGWLAWTAVGVLVQVYRYFRVSTAIERQQTKWIVFGFAATIFVLCVAVLPNIVFPVLREPISARLVYLLAALTAALLSFLIVPLTVSLAILRYRLWDIDLLLNRTLVYGALTAAVVALYVAVVGTLGALFQAAGNALLSVLATGLIAILFSPLRQRLQSGVNRLMYGDRDDPATVLARLGQRLETAIAPEATLTSIVETVAQTLKVPYAAIEVIDGQQPRIVAYPAASPLPPATARFPLVYQTKALGYLSVAPRTPTETLNIADRRLLEQIARQAAPAVHAYRLTADLHRSRERIIVAREAERRRLRRDLHDGLGPTLASQAFKLDAAMELFEPDPVTAQRLLDEVKAQTQATVADIRRLVYELRPPALDELGLLGALRAYVQSLPPVNSPRVTVEAPPHLPPLSAAVEVAAYRVVLEALTNVLRHAEAQTCQLQLAVDGNRLQLSVTDDGVGLPNRVTDGMGLTSMRERADELGGTCRIEQSAGGGTRVTVELPIGPTDDD